MSEGLSIGTPIMLNLYRSPQSFLMPYFMATNSAPKMDVLIVACFFETHSIMAVLQKIIIPVCDCRVCLTPVWSLSTYIWICT